MGAFERRRSRKNKKRKAKRKAIAAANVAAVADVRAIKALGYEDGAINGTERPGIYDMGYGGDAI